MRPGRFAVFVFLVALFFLLAASVRYAIFGPPEPPIVLDYPTIIDIGPKKSGVVADASLTLRNTSSRPITIDQFATSCSCAGVERRLDGRSTAVESVVLSPRSECELWVRIGVAGKIGEPQSVSVFFRIDGEHQKSGSIRIVISRVEGGLYAQASVVLLKPDRPGAAATQVIEIFDNGTPGVQFEEISSSRSDRFQVRKLELADEDRTKIHASAGRLCAKIEVKAQTRTATRLDGDVRVKIREGRDWALIVPVCGDASSEIKP